jgi:hypothetical protein
VTAPKPSLTKFDVARRQIDAAIKLLFQGGDTVAVHTLSMAAFGILYDISKGQDGLFHLHFDEMILPGKEKEFWRHFNKWSNFSKHADRDPDGTIDILDESVNDFLLFFCCLGFTTNGQATTHRMKMFTLWFATLYPALIKEGTELKAKIESETAFAKHLSRTALLEVGLRALNLSTS